MYLSKFLMNLSAIFTAAIARRPRLCYSIYMSMRNAKEAAVLDTIYLDNASTTFPKPACVPEAMLRYITGCGSNIARGGYSAAYSAEEMVFETRERICSLFGGEDSRCVVFTKNVTESLNVLLKGLLRPGDHVLVSSMEHNAVMRPLRQLEAQGVTFSCIPCRTDGTLIAEAAEPLLRPSTRAVVMTHASNVCGTLLPIAEMGELCRRHGLLFLVDSAQTAGVFPIDMQAMHISALAFTGHKGLMGPQGTGGLCIRPGVELRPLLRGGTGIHSYDREQPQAYPARLEAGTLNTHGIAGLHAALKFIEKQTVQAIGAHERALMRRFYDGVKDLDGVTVYGDFSRSERAAIVALNIRDYDSAEVADALFADYDIATRAGAHCAPRMHEALGTVQQGAVRFSFSYFNTENEVDTAIAAVRELAE